ncbi:Peptidase S1 and S6 chymotrypsin/Hap [Vibrio crassostreae]|nr:conserved hypothetical protein [Vibrio chagasii]CAK1805333.1 Peptidase S1 and S6 chymotrypsin/Hap [Vibrio crassostreae]CAK1814440.1 Peptidase S1 and S6 chymotrypsin/Hap [Vibrio crassostreae]CAK2678794.1 Peptidase S1 and S6 chymotrypsin/Hap [Vibrio crassostreae]CAK2683701.1 Peptidase S1 and S6 chymotrypsin/Hap [Vibrio crassostreae]
MIELKEKIKSNFVFIKNQGIHVGCGFILPVRDKIYCVTAGHVIFGKSFDSELELDMYDIAGNLITDIQCITDLAFARDFDIAVLRIDCNMNNIEDVIVTTPIMNSSFYSLSYVKPQALVTPFFINTIVVDEKLDGNRVRYKVPNGSFSNFVEDEHGADAMEGISGSPALLCTPDASIVFHGVIDKIPNQGVAELLEIRGLEPILQIIEDLELKPCQDFDESTTLIRFNTKLIEDVNFEQWVDMWRTAKGNEKYYGNLKMKLETIFGESYTEELPIELERIMIGDECVKNIIERDSQLFESYRDIIKTAEREKMLAYVSNEQQAYDHYQTIYQDHLDVVKEDLSVFKLRTTDLKKIAQYNVSTWLAVCNLRFKKK